MPDWDIAEPRADALIESLRAFGYSPETAVADLIDNSISAGSRHIDVEFFWSGLDSYVRITDDGTGMDEGALVAAMRPGSTSPLDARDPSDLGRFGLGLKTASFSQARELTVATRSEGSTETAVRRWDLDTVATTGEWRLLRTPAKGIELTSLGRGHGTVILWSKCDRLVGHVDRADEKAQARFNKVADRVARHLEAVFAQFMNGRRRIRIRVNGNTLLPWDPFMEPHASTQNLGTELLPYRGTTIRVTPWVLPHRSKLSDEEQSRGAGTAGWTQQQGFYLYRSNRLLMQGGWLDLGFARDEHTKLARIRVDFPAPLDHDWQVDVKKSVARVPGPLQPDLHRIAAATRRAAEDVYRHRGKIIARHSAQDFVLGWLQIKTRDGDVRYRINREHPVIATLLKTVGDKRTQVNRTLRFIEETMPTTLIGVSIATALDRQAIPFSDSRPELRTLLRLVFDELLTDGLSRDQALDRLAAAEPFTSYPALIQVFRESL